MMLVYSQNMDWKPSIHRPTHILWYLVSQCKICFSPQFEFSCGGLWLVSRQEQPAWWKHRVQGTGPYGPSRARICDSWRLLRAAGDVHLCIIEHFCLDSSFASPILFWLLLHLGSPFTHLLFPLLHQPSALIVLNVSLSEFADNGA